MLNYPCDEGVNDKQSLFLRGEVDRIIVDNGSDVFLDLICQYFI